MTLQEERNARIMKAIAEYTAEHTKTPEAARAAMMKTGIYTPEGALRPEYGGKPIRRAKKG